MSSIANRDLSILIPAFNESRGIEPLLDALAEELPERRFW